MELAPEKLIEMLEKGESLPNVILMYGEENYYRSKAAACIKKYVFGSAADEDTEISVFDRDTDDFIRACSIRQLFGICAESIGINYFRAGRRVICVHRPDEIWLGYVLKLGVFSHG